MCLNWLGVSDAGGADAVDSDDEVPVKKKASRGRKNDERSVNCPYLDTIKRSVGQVASGVGCTISCISTYAVGILAVYKHDGLARRVHREGPGKG